MEEILCAFDTARDLLGLSEQAVSLRAGANPHLLPDIPRGHVPSVERVRADCDALGLAFYVGLPRPEALARPLVRAAGVDREELNQLEQATRAFVRARAAHGGDPMPEGLREGAARRGGT